MEISQQHSRFRDAPWYPKEETFLLIGGAGGIGSWVTLLLTRAGFKPIVYDFDILEDHNLGGQIFSRQHIGQPKVIALQKMVKDFTGDEITIFNEKITSESLTHIYVISAFDNMKARKEMFQKWYDYMSENPELRSKGIFIDGRLTAEQMQIFCIQGNNAELCEKYKTEHLFEDSEVEDAPCTMKQTSHSAAMIASHMTGFFTNHITNVVEEQQIRTVPFMWEYFIPMDLLTIEYH